MKKIFNPAFSIVLGVLSLTLMLACSKNQRITVCFVPLDGIGKSQIETLQKDFKEHFADKRVEVFFLEGLDHFNTPDSCINKKYQRLDASTMLKFLEAEFGDIAEERAKNNSVGESSAYYIIGVTNKDIAIPLHDKPNYGILGLSRLGGDVSVISTYRLKNKKELWKLAMHEFGHGYFSLNHCKNDDPSCIMANAKGGNPHFELKDTLCSSCYVKSMRQDIIRKIIN